jgi:hypothetical protein
MNAFRLSRGMPGPEKRLSRKSFASCTASEAGEFLERAVPDSVALDDIRALARVVLNLPVEETRQRGFLDLLFGWFMK